MLDLKNISKNYGSFALQDINLRIEEGEYFVLLGRSGSGKSQLLEIISGLVNPDSGEIILDKKDISDCRIQSRPVGLVYQDFALFPHLSVRDNIAYSLKMSRISKSDIDSKVKKIAGETNISHLLMRETDGLSGGEKQRVAVARTLVRSPKIILLDEPMASIDTPLRDDLRRLLRNINRLGMTVLHVTHDYREAIRLAHRVGVIHNGRIIQSGRPEEVFGFPVNRFVARFAGIQNFFKVDIVKESGEFIGKGQNDFDFILPLGHYKSDGIVMLRSEDIYLSYDKPESQLNCKEGVVTEINRAERGYEAYIEAGETFYVTLAGQKVVTEGIKEGDKIYVSFKPEVIRVM